MISGTTKPVDIIGGGLAGSEAALWLARRGIAVRLFEMRPYVMTGAHKTGSLAELVCSNSLKSKEPNSAPARLKREMHLLGSFLLCAAEQASIPGGQALTVDRDRFSQIVNDAVRTHKYIEVIGGECPAPETTHLSLIATGPLTSSGLAGWIRENVDASNCYFYDAIAPIVDASTLDFENIFKANRYEKGGEAAYLNCPLDRETYENFIRELLAGEKVKPKDFEEERLFQGCQPIESIAATGPESLRFGPMKPVGLTDPKTDRRPYAAIQLRAENAAGTAFNLVGFQTKLTYPEQKRVFAMIPALKHAEYFRMGSIHRNFFINSPVLLESSLALRSRPNVFFAGQITGVEGYTESMAMGLWAAIGIFCRLRGRTLTPPPETTAIGALVRAVTKGNTEDFQPMNINFGIFPPLTENDPKPRGRDENRRFLLERAERDFEAWLMEFKSALDSTVHSSPHDSA